MENKRLLACNNAPGFLVVQCLYITIDYTDYAARGQGKPQPLHAAAQVSDHC